MGGSDYSAAERFLDVLYGDLRPTEFIRGQTPQTRAPRSNPQPQRGQSRNSRPTFTPVPTSHVDHANGRADEATRHRPTPRRPDHIHTHTAPPGPDPSLPRSGASSAFKRVPNPRPSRPVRGKGPSLEEFGRRDSRPMHRPEPRAARPVTQDHPTRPIGGIPVIASRDSAFTLNREAYDRPYDWRRYYNPARAAEQQRADDAARAERQRERERREARRRRDDREMWREYEEAQRQLAEMANNPEAERVIHLVMGNILRDEQAGHDLIRQAREVAARLENRSDTESSGRSPQPQRARRRLRRADSSGEEDSGDSGDSGDSTDASAQRRRH